MELGQILCIDGIEGVSLQVGADSHKVGQILNVQVGSILGEHTLHGLVCFRLGCLIGGAAGSGIESIDLPSSVTTIGEYAFDNCASLTSVNCYPTTPPTLGNIYVFDHTTTIHVPATAYEEYLNAENWKRLKAQIVGDL